MIEWLKTDFEQWLDDWKPTLKNDWKPSLKNDWKPNQAKKSALFKNVLVNSKTLNLMKLNTGQN